VACRSRCMIVFVFDSLTPDQQTLRDRFATLGAELEPLLQAAAPGAMPRPAWQRLADSGIFGFPVPKSAGGTGRGALDTVLAFEGLGLGCADLGFLFAANAHLWGAVLPLALHGDARQIARWLPPLLDGRTVGAHGVTEEGTGSDVRGMATTMEAHGDLLRVRGSKAYITCAPRADTFLVYTRDARIETARPELGAVLLERSDGVATDVQDKMGLRGAPMGTMTFDVVVPGDRAVGAPGSGMAMFTTALEWERACVFAPFVGAMDRQLVRCVRRARSRRQFGSPIGRFQAVSHRIADMKTRLDLSRMLLYRAATAKEGGARAPVEAAQAKLYIAEAFLQSSIDAVRIAGGSGYLDEADAAIELRDAMGGPLFSGTSDIQKNIIAGFLGL
jgi:alkylation response protein AidB-like acyl-CoA dehydrogenase